MNSILFLGYSNVFKSRILPILSRLDIQKVSIAKYYLQEWDDAPANIEQPVTLYDTYEQAFSDFSGNLVYITTVNSTHYQFARQALLQGFNVIVDKPITLAFEESCDLLNIARSKGLLICESTVYLDHPQMKLVSDIFNKNGENPKLITAHFTLPPFQENNFRYKQELGGGAIADTAPYAVSLGRYFFKEPPLKVTCTIHERNDEVELQYSLLMSYPNGKCLIGHFGFTTEYVNQILVMGNRLNVSLNRVFTITEDMENNLTVSKMNSTEQVKAPKGNTFQLFLTRVLEKFNNQSFEEFYQDLEYDSLVRKMIINTISQ